VTAAGETNNNNNNNTTNATHEDSTESDDGRDLGSSGKESHSRGGHKSSRPKSGATASSASNKRNTLNENETLKAKLAESEEKLEKARKEVADLSKQLKKAKAEAPSSDNAQASQLLSILARVNSAAAWSVRVKALEPLLSHLATVKNFEASAPSVVAGHAHVQAMQAFDTKSKSASGSLLNDAEAIVAQFGQQSKLSATDREVHLKLLDKVSDALNEVARDTSVPSAIPPQAISKVYSEFAAYKAQFEATVVPSHAKIAKIIADLIATLDESAKMNAIVDEADGQFNELFVNTKFYVESRRARQPDPEYAALRAHYDAQLAALHAEAKQKVAATQSAKEHDRLTEEIKEARKKLRAKERELEDLRDDGELVAGSPNEQKRVDEINALRATLADLVRRDDEAARIAAGGSVAATPAAAGPLELTRRKLDSAYTYEPLAAGVLKGSLHGSDSKCVLKVTQVPPDAVLAQQLELLGRLKHANLAAVGAAFVDGPHLYVELPFYERGNFEQWLTTAKPDVTAIQRVMFNVLSALAYMHDRGSVHGAVRPEAILIDSQDRAVLNSFWAKPSAERSADEYAAPELASGSLKEANAAADVFSFGLLLVRAFGSWPARKAPTEQVAIPKVKDKHLASLWASVLDAEPLKRSPALKLLNHAYFAPQFASVEALLTTNKGLRATRSALVQLGHKQKLLGDAEIEEALAHLRDSTLFDSPGGAALPVATDDAASLAKIEAVGKALLHATLRQRPTAARLAPTVLKHLISVLPTSVRDLLRDMEAFDAARARHFRHVRLVDDVCPLGLKMADGSAVTNTNREAYLQQALGRELVDSRLGALEKLRAGFFSLAGVKDEVAKLKPSELAVVIAGDEYLSGELVLARTVVEPPTANASAFQLSVRSLASDDLRRLLYAVTGVATITPSTAITVVVASESGAAKHSISFLPLFSRIDLVVGTAGTVEEALGEALTAIDAPLQ
jgi:serine/threonine protein kinase